MSLSEVFDLRDCLPGSACLPGSVSQPAKCHKASVSLLSLVSSMRKQALAAWGSGICSSRAKHRA
jgi:hypothetical protein